MVSYDVSKKVITVKLRGLIGGRREFVFIWEASRGCIDCAYL